MWLTADPIICSQVMQTNSYCFPRRKSLNSICCIDIDALGVCESYRGNLPYLKHIHIQYFNFRTYWHCLWKHFHEKLNFRKKQFLEFHNFQKRHTLFEKTSEVQTFPTYLSPAAHSCYDFFEWNNAVEDIFFKLTCIRDFFIPVTKSTGYQMSFQLL